MRERRRSNRLVLYFFSAPQWAFFAFRLFDCAALTVCDLAQYFNHAAPSLVFSLIICSRRNVTRCFFPTHVYCSLGFHVRLAWLNVRMSNRKEHPNHLRQSAGTFRLREVGHLQYGTHDDASACLVYQNGDVYYLSTELWSPQVTRSRLVVAELVNKELLLVRDPRERLILEQVAASDATHGELDGL